MLFNVWIGKLYLDNNEMLFECFDTTVYLESAKCQKVLKSINGYQFLQTLGGKVSPILPYE